MASPTPSWMKPEPVNEKKTRFPIGQHQLQPDPQKPHQGWPWSQAIYGVGYDILEATLRDNQGTACRVAHYTSPPGGPPLWTFEKSATTVQALIDVITQAGPGRNSFYIVSTLQSEAMQALGHYLDIAPRLFSLPYVPSRTNSNKRSLMFSMQYMNKYQLGYKPSEARRSVTSPSYRFHSQSGPLPHEWHVTCVRAAILEGNDLPAGQKAWRGLCQIDTSDDNIALKLRGFMTRADRSDSPINDTFGHLGQILSDVVYIVTWSWKHFFIEAEAHLQQLSQKCVHEDLDSEDQLRYTRELHQLSPLWVEARRRLTAAKGVIISIVEHPFVHADRHTVEPLVSNKLAMLDDLISRSNEASEQTSNLISLIFNIATMQDTRAAIQESKAANAFAASVRRITMLTFIYLPLTLAASIFGMNVKQITGEGTHSQLWLYFVVAVVLTLATCGGWFLWSQMLPRIQRRTHPKTALHGPKHKGV